MNKKVDTFVNDQYAELRIDPSELYNVKNKKKKEPRCCQRPGCNNLIKHRGLKRKYCSVECSGIVSRIPRSCQFPGCNNPLHTNRPWTKFCSVECRQKWEKGPEKFCKNPECGKKLEKNWQKKYCSTSCSGIHKFGKNEKYTHCQNSECNKKLTLDQIKGGNKFCTLECNHASKKTHDGHIVLRKDSKRWKYPKRFMKRNGEYVLLAKVTWEKANNQATPKGWGIGYKDGNTFNDEDVDNLFIFDPKKTFGRNKTVSKEEEIKNESEGNFITK